MLSTTATVLLGLSALAAPHLAAARLRTAELASTAAASGESIADVMRADLAHRRRLQFSIAASPVKKRPVEEPLPEKLSHDEEEELVQCTTHTTEIEVEVENNADIHADAISEAFALACQEGSEVNMAMFEDIFLQEDAFAFAHATAIAMITCESTDEDAYHCASVTASATAFAEATAEAHASAVSKAVSSCGCMTDAVSVAVASSDTYIKLIAEATATATASVCIEGVGKVSATAYDSCSSLVFGKVFARAVSEAIVRGNCMNSEAISRVLTEAGYEFDSYSTCGMTAEAIKL